MAKGIIVMDIPASCDNCELMCTNQNDDKFCFKHGFHEPIESTRPDWCPIKPLPEKITHKSRQGLLQEQVALGWNLCLDEILGE